MVVVEAGPGYCPCGPGQERELEKDWELQGQAGQAEDDGTDFQQRAAGACVGVEGFWEEAQSGCPGHWRLRLLGVLEKGVPQAPAEAHRRCPHQRPRPLHL